MSPILSKYEQGVAEQGVVAFVVPKLKLNIFGVDMPCVETISANVPIILRELA
jgi:hypothetical protein